MPIQLSERQQQTLAAALTVLASAVLLCAVGVTFWLLSAFLVKFSSVFLPLAAAGVAALILKPYYEWLEERVPRAVALTVIFLSLILPFVLVLVVVVNQVADLVARFPDWWSNASEWVEARWPRILELSQEYHVQERLNQVVEERQDTLISGLRMLGDKALSAGLGAFSAAGSLLGWFVAPIYLAFFLLIDPGLTGGWTHIALPFLKPSTREDIAYLVGEFLSILVAFFRGQLLIALAQGILFALGFGLAGLKLWLLIGLTMGFLNIIPYLGSLIGLGIALPLAFFQDGGGTWTLLWVMIAFGAVQMIEGYVLTPRIMGNQTGLHPMAIMVGIFFWGTALNGILGMLLAIPLTAFFVVFWRLAREKYIRELV